jgi:hypothetical protein
MFIKTEALCCKLTNIGIINSGTLITIGPLHNEKKKCKKAAVPFVNIFQNALFNFKAHYS